MTIFGIAWMILEIICFLKKDIKYITVLTILGMTFQCNNIISMGNFGVGPQIISSIIFSLKVIIQSKGIIKIPKKNKYIIITMIIMLIAVFISLYKNQLVTEKLLVFLQLMSYILCFICMNVISEKVNDDFVYKLVRRITIFLLIVGAIQFLITSNVIPRLSIISEIFFNEKRGAVYYYRNNYYRITSTFMEPSYFSGFIVGALFYLISFKEKFKSNIFLILAICIEIILTFSSTAYGTLIIVSIIYLIFSDLKIKDKIILITLLAILYGVMYFGFYGVLDKVIFSKEKSGSANKRNNMNDHAIETFLENPIFGKRIQKL